MPPTVPEAPRRRRPGPALALLAFAQLIISVDYNIVYVALPDIGSGLGFSAQSLQWVISAYAVAFGGFLLLGGRAGDLFGPRRMFTAGLVLYAVSSLLGGLAESAAVLTAAAAGLVLLAVFVAVERRSADPLLPLRLFADRDLSVGTAVTFAYMGTFGTLLYFLTVYFQGVHGYDPLATGLAFLAPMRAATSDGLRTAVLIAAAGIAVTVLAALGLRKHGAGQAAEADAPSDARPAVHV
ncbi:MFS transporter [Actinomadura sp. GTD37]|uniref:MFS transporter n=1 Tax=Actinomadura sp. GTD37 TaxID=1778030 RepID=UPI0035C10F33